MRGKGDSDNEVSRKVEIWNLQKSMLYKEIQFLESKSTWEKKYNEIFEINQNNQKIIVELQDEILNLQTKLNGQKINEDNEKREFTAQLDPTVLQPETKSADQKEPSKLLKKIPLFRKMSSSSKSKRSNAPSFRSLFRQLDEEITLLNDTMTASNSRITRESSSLMDKKRSSSKSTHEHEVEDCVANADVIACLCNRVNELEETLRQKNKEIDILCLKTQEYANRLTILEESEISLTQKDQEINFLCQKLQGYADIADNLDSNVSITNQIEKTPSERIPLALDDDEPEVTKPSSNNYSTETTRCAEFKDKQIEFLNRNLQHLRHESSVAKSEESDLRRDYETLLSRHSVAMNEVARLVEIIESQLPSSKSKLNVSLFTH